MRRICTFVELFKFFLISFWLCGGKHVCLLSTNRLIFQTRISLQERSKKSHQINFTSLDVNSDFFLSKSHQKNKRVYDDRF